MNETNLARQPIRAPRGTVLSCRGWPQEAALRLLMNCIEADVAERPESLIMHGTAQPIADWGAFRETAAALRKLESNETLTTDAGKPVSISRSTPQSPRVIIEDADWSRRPHAASTSLDPSCGWAYVGSQTALPIAYETYAAAAHQHFGGTLKGRLVLCGGMGGIGSAHPLAATMCGAAFLGVDADPERIKRRVKTGYCELMVNDLDEALRILKNAVRKHEPASVGLIGNCAELIPDLAQRGIVPDLAIDLTPADAVAQIRPSTGSRTGNLKPFSAYIPAGMGAAQAEELSRMNPDAYCERALDSIAAHATGLLELRKLGSMVLNSGNGLFSLAAEHGVSDAAVISVPASLYLREFLDEGFAVATLVSLSGEPLDIARADRTLLEFFPSDERLRNWIALAGKHVRHQGLPARTCLLTANQAAQLAAALNQAVARGDIRAPVVLAAPNEFASRPTWVWRAKDGSAGHALVLDGSSNLPSS